MSNLYPILVRIVADVDRTETLLETLGRVADGSFNPYSSSTTALSSAGCNCTPGAFLLGVKAEIRTPPSSVSREFLSGHRLFSI